MKRILNSIGDRFRPVLRSPALVILLGATVFSPSLFAQSSTNRLDLSNRWLFIVDTSRAQKKRAETVRQIAGSLLMSGVNGQMRAGDTVGVWTYNETLHSGDLPLQEWTPDTNRKVTQHVYDFLENQKFENDSQLDKVMPEVNRIVKNSDFITVILISDGSTEMHGTPFDDKINVTYKSWSEELPDNQKLIVTLLRASHGKFTDYTVNMPPWPFEAPPLPADLLTERTSAMVKREKAAVPPAPVYAAPLIVSGKKSEATTTQTVAHAASGTATGSPQPGTPAASTTPTAAKPPGEKAVAQNSGETLGGITAQARTASQPGTPAQTAVVVPSGIWSGHKAIWLAGASLVAIVFGWIVLRMRQSRSSVHISLVPRSLDRDKK